MMYSGAVELLAGRGAQRRALAARLNSTTKALIRPPNPGLHSTFLLLVRLVMKGNICAGALGGRALAGKGETPMVGGSD